MSPSTIQDFSSSDQQGVPLHTPWTYWIDKCVTLSPPALTRPFQGQQGLDGGAVPGEPEEGLHCVDGAGILVRLQPHP
jgi:hypothetical protein